MTMNVNAYGNQNHSQQNLKAGNPSFGMAWIHKSVAKKAAKCSDVTVQKLGHKIWDSKLPHVLTGSLLGAYYLKNNETGAKVEVVSPSKKQGTTIKDTLSDADKKLMIIEVFGTEDNESIQKIASNDRLCANLQNLQKLSHGEHKGIVRSMAIKSQKDDFLGQVALTILACANEKNISYAPMIYDNAIKEKIVGTGRYKGDPRTADEIEEDISPENLRFLPDIMKNVNAENSKYVPEIILQARANTAGCIPNVMQFITKDNESSFLSLFRAAQWNDDALFILNTVPKEKVKYIPLLMQEMNFLDYQNINTILSNITDANAEDVINSLRELKNRHNKLSPLSRYNNHFYIRSAMTKMTRANQEIVLDLFKKGQDDTPLGKAACRIIKDAGHAQMKYAADVLPYVTEENYKIAGYAVDSMTDENKEFVLDLFQKGETILPQCLL